MTQRVLLLNPYRNSEYYIPQKLIRYYQNTAAYGDGVNYIPPLEFAYLYPLLVSAECEVTFIDAHIEKRMPWQLPLHEYDTIVMCTAPYDLYQCSPGYVDHVNDIITRAGKGVRIIIYGTHATQDPRSFPDADVIIQGEPELSIIEALTAPRGTILPPHYFKRGDLDSLPPPEWSIYSGFGMYDGTDNCGFFTTPGPTAAYTTNRGCFARCSFCNVFSMFPEMSYHSVERVIADLTSLANTGVRNVIMLDKVFTAHRPTAKKIMKAMIEANLKLEYEVMLRADCVDAEVAELLYKSGCRHIVLGIESASDSVLELMQKKISWESVQSCMHILTPYTHFGMQVDSFRVAFSPGEAHVTLAETHKRFVSMGWDDSPHISTAYPDTPQWTWGIEEGKIIDRRSEGISLDWSQTALTAGTIRTIYSREQILKHTHSPWIRMQKIWKYTKVNGPRKLMRAAWKKLRSGKLHFSM